MRPVCKPSSVFDGHLSRPAVTDRLKRFWRTMPGQHFVVLSCTKWGLHERFVAKASVSSYLAFPPLHREMRYISVALSLKSPSQGITLHPCPAVLGLSSCCHAAVWPAHCKLLYHKHRQKANGVYGGRAYFNFFCQKSHL